MSRTFKTDPTWVKQTRASTFTESHSCADHGGRWLCGFGDCTLPDHAPRTRADIHARWDYRQCSWEPDFRPDVWVSMFPAHTRDSRYWWHRGNRNAARIAALAMAREHNAGGDVSDHMPDGRHRNQAKWED